jgi:hypothetical protein
MLHTVIYNFSRQVSYFDVNVAKMRTRDKEKERIGLNMLVTGRVLWRESKGSVRII